MEYSTDLFDAATVDRMLAHYRILLEEIIAHPDQPIGALPMLTDLEPNSLPEPMIPSAYVVLEAAAVSQRQGRPGGPARSRRVDERLVALTAAPRGPVEEVVASVWGTVLGLDRVGAHDSFFDIGGHSLLATQVVSRLREAFGVEIPLRTLFEAPTVAGLAERIEAMRRGGARRESSPIEPTARVGPLPLSFSQEALWFLDQLAPGSRRSTSPRPCGSRGRSTVAALERSLNELVRRHESLRTSFVATGGTPHQVVDPTFRLSLEMVDLTASAARGSRE